MKNCSLFFCHAYFISERPSLIWLLTSYLQIFSSLWGINRLALVKLKKRESWLNDWAPPNLAVLRNVVTHPGTRMACHLGIWNMGEKPRDLFPWVWFVENSRRMSLEELNRSKRIINKHLIKAKIRLPCYWREYGIRKSCSQNIWITETNGFQFRLAYHSWVQFDVKMSQRDRHLWTTSNTVFRSLEKREMIWNSNIKLSSLQGINTQTKIFILSITFSGRENKLGHWVG